ncbi:MAG: YdbL family protein [Proteobacteria bacterium]|nr:YdbL family protein [Pseudomonadota bacterium]
MRRWMGIPLAAVLLTACVTINVYFPAAEAKEAAREFVDNVIGDDAEPSTDSENGDPGAALGPRADRRIDWLALVGIGSAHAQSRPDITIRTPAIQAIQARMAARFDSQLRAGFDAGALGFAADGTIVVRDASKLALKDRVAVNQAVADDNRDRRAVYREVAVANGHPEWESQIRDVFARQWIASARPGWWYQSGGSWQQK